MSRLLHNSLSILIASVVLWLHGCHQNDHMFPPAPAAKSSISYDGTGFLINGKRTFLVSGSLHYARIPRELWRDRLLRLKRAGFNTVETYAFWNFHEERQGQWNFSGDHDLDAFLKLAQSLGLYTVVRVGPYCCAEWDSGGFPVYLRFIPGLKVRLDNAAFEAAGDDWYNHVMPIVAANQINRGGSVIMVQLENEDMRGWGTKSDSYLDHLRQKALSFGLEVPYFFSGLHHGEDPAGNKPWDSAGRPDPWYSTEMWLGWFDIYGNPKPDLLNRINRAVWNVVADGGNGFNDYMFHGGTNFDHWNDENSAASYDYGAAVGEAGDLRTTYYRMKRLALFATSFPDILENSGNATDAFKTAATGVQVRARSAPAGTLLFLGSGQQPEKNSIRVALPGNDVYPTAGKLTVLPFEVVPLVVDHPLDDQVRLTAAARVLGIDQEGKTTTLVVHGPVGDVAEVRFQTSTAPEILAGAPQLAITSRERSNLVLTTTIAPQPGEFAFRIAGRTYRILVLDTATADRTWFVSTAQGHEIVCGADYVGEANDTTQGFQLQVETYPESTIDGTAPAESPRTLHVYGETLDARIRNLSAPSIVPAAPALNPWQTTPGIGEAQPGFNDSHWMTSTEPQPLGADGDGGAYAWYRTTLQIPAQGSFHVSGAASDWACVFIDGKPVGVTGNAPNNAEPVHFDFSADLTPGEHLLAILTSQNGRSKLLNYAGPLALVDLKGLRGAVTLLAAGAVPSQALEIKNWKMRGGLSKPWDEKIPLWHADVPPLQPATWYRTTFTTHPSAVGPLSVLRFATTGLSHGFAWINGHILGRYPQRLPVDGLYVPECWLVDGENELILFDEDGKSPANAHLTIETAASRDVQLVTVPLKSSP